MKKSTLVSIVGASVLAVGASTIAVGAAFGTGVTTCAGHTATITSSADVVYGTSGADVIVVPTHGETGWRHAIFGSVAERVVRLAPCPVIVVRQPKG